MRFPTGTRFTLPSRETTQGTLVALMSAHRQKDHLDAAIHEALRITSQRAGSYTGSLDAATDLSELVLKGWSLDTQSGRAADERTIEEHGPGPHLYATLSRPLGLNSFSPVSPPCVGATKGLSVCIALFTAILDEIGAE